MAQTNTQTQKIKPHSSRPTDSLQATEEQLSQATSSLMGHRAETKPN
ncbi:MAG: hypothetical protein ACRCZI_05815 [Cetobacterium sp.]